jgi:hypothetical protein
VYVSHLHDLDAYENSIAYVMFFNPYIPDTFNILDKFRAEIYKYTSKEKRGETPFILVGVDHIVSTSQPTTTRNPDNRITLSQVEQFCKKCSPLSAYVEVASPVDRLQVHRSMDMVLRLSYMFGSKFKKRIISEDLLRKMVTYNTQISNQKKKCILQ